MGRINVKKLAEDMEILAEWQRNLEVAKQQLAKDIIHLNSLVDELKKRLEKVEVIPRYINGNEVEEKEGKS